MTSRQRLGALIAGTLVLLAFATTAEQRDLTVVPAASASEVAAADGIGPASQWCEQRKPHTGDTVTYSEWYALNQSAATANCIATHDAGATWHFYRVTVWADGHVQWTPLGPWWT